MNTYQLRVSIIGIPKLYRMIEISGDCTFDDLHLAIFNAFDRYDHHLYSFFITRSNTESMASIMDSPEITHPANTEDLFGSGEKKDSAAETKIDRVGLVEKDVFHYLFDFGDDWWHRIRVAKVLDNQEKRKGVRVIKAVGAAPPQYPEDESE